MMTRIVVVLVVERRLVQMVALQPLKEPPLLVEELAPMGSTQQRMIVMLLSVLQPFQ